ncbi:MAG: GNAT family N-acetyltransferase [Hyphomicrobiales bacterium]
MSKHFPLTLRPGQPGDVDELVGLASAAMATSIGKLPEFAGRETDIHVAFTRFITDAVGQIIIAEHQGKLLGFAATEGQSDEISDVWVDPKHQGKGIGAVLLSACEAQIKQWGFSCSWLTTHAGNSRASSFYRTHGYVLLNVHTAPSASLPGISYPKALLGKQLSRPNAAKAYTMADVRVGIDTLDPMIVSLLAERFAFIDRAADLKPALAMPARVHDRVEEVVANARAQAEGIGFDPDLTEKLWRTMIDLAIDREDNKMGAHTHEHVT